MIKSPIFSFLFLCTTCIAQNIITTLDSSGNVGLFSSLYIPDDGFPIISYYDATNSDLKILKCGNVTCSSNNIISVLDSVGNVGTFPSNFVSADGLPVISYFDAANFNVTNSGLKVLKCGDATCSSDNTITKVDSIGIVGTHSSIFVPVDGLPIISYLDNTNLDQKVLKCGNANCSSANIITTVDTNGGGHTSVFVPDDGLPVISYFEEESSGLKVLKCGNNACSSENITNVVDTTGHVGWDNSIFVPIDGLPVISYEDRLNGNLKVLKCGNAFCTSGNIITSVDTIGYVGSSTSIFVPPDGLPIISYRDVTNKNLKVLKCGNTSCSSSNTIMVVDTAGNVGAATSVFVPFDGLPVISYVDDDNGYLKVIKCSRHDCSEISSNLKYISKDEELITTTMLEGLITIYIKKAGFVQIFNLFGNVIYENNLISPGNIKIHELEQGVYLVRLTLQEAVVIRKVSKLF